MTYLLDILPPPDPISLEIGLDLIPLACGSIIPQLYELCHAMGLECGIDVPPILVRDNAALEPREYRIRVHGFEAAHGTLPDDGSAPVLLKHLAKVIRQHSAELAS